MQRMLDPNPGCCNKASAYMVLALVLWATGGVPVWCYFTALFSRAAEETTAPRRLCVCVCVPTLNFQGLYEASRSQCWRTERQRNPTRSFISVSAHLISVTWWQRAEERARGTPTGDSGHASGVGWFCLTDIGKPWGWAVSLDTTNCKTIEKQWNSLQIEVFLDWSVSKSLEIHL